MNNIKQAFELPTEALSSSCSLDFSLKSEDRIQNAIRTWSTIQQASVDQEKALNLQVQLITDAIQEQGVFITELTQSILVVADQLSQLQKAVQPSLAKLQVPKPEDSYREEYTINRNRSSWCG